MAMDDSVVDFSASANGEQGRNPVQTGFPSPETLAMLQRAMGEWAEQNRLDAVLLRALIRLAAKSPEQASEGFTPLELAEEMNAHLKKEWASLTDKELVSKNIRSQWNRAQDLWRTKLEGLQQMAVDSGLQDFFEPGRSTGGGSGNLTRYWLRPAPLAPLQQAPQHEASDVGSSATVEISYICEDVSEPHLLTRAFAHGLFMQGWRRIVIMNVFGILALILVSLGVLLTVAITGSHLMGLERLGPAASLIIILVAVWASGGPLLRIGKSRIEAAPWWMQSWNDDRLLELRCPPRHPIKMIKAVHYSGRCPICNGKVSAQSGGLRFWGRIVGRCDEAPAEHVFSFDHMTRRGRKLTN